MSRKLKFNSNALLFILLGLLIMAATIWYVIYYSINNAETSTKDKEITTSKDKLENKNTKKAAKKDGYSEVLISFGGDSTIGHDTKFAFANSLPDVLSKNNNDFSYFFKNVASIFKNDDISIVNLETVFTNSKDRAEKQFNFKADPSYAQALPLGHIEGVDISNNHIYDYKQKGFDDTLEALKTNNINYFGEGHTWIKEVNGVKFAFLGYTGYNDYAEFRQKLEKDIKKLKPILESEGRFGTLIPNVANAETNTTIKPNTRTIHTYAIIGNVTINVFKKYNPTRPTISHLAIVNGSNPRNPAGAPMIVKIPIKSRSLNPSIASNTPRSVIGIAKINPILPAKAFNISEAIMS